MGNMTPLLVSNSTITIGSSKCPDNDGSVTTLHNAAIQCCSSPGALKLYCRSLCLVKPVVNTSPFFRYTAWAPLDPSCATASSSTLPSRGSTRRIFLSLQVNSTSLPSQFQQALSTSSGSPKVRRHSPVPTFQMHTLLSLPAERRTFCALGCQSTMPTLRWWKTRSTTHSVMVRVTPLSGICHTFTVQSSLAEAAQNTLHY